MVGSKMVGPRNKIGLLLAVLGICMLLAGPAHADLTYTESGLDFSNFNITSPFGAAKLYDLDIMFNKSISVTGFTLPQGWSDITGAGFFDLFSTNSKYDLSPGSLVGLKLTFSSAPAAMTFLAHFEDANGRYGTSGNGSSVPIPASAILLGSGLLGIIGFGLRRQRKHM